MVPVSYMHRELVLTADEASRITLQNEESVAQSKKLNLVLDLDLTLLNSCSINTAQSNPFIMQCHQIEKENLKRGIKMTLCHLKQSGIMTKLRPKLFEFIEEMNEYI